MDTLTNPNPLFLEGEEFIQLISKTAEIFSTIAKKNENTPVTPLPLLAEVKRRIAAKDFQKPIEATALLEWTVGQMAELDIHLANPHYFGVFNPQPSSMGIAGDLLASAFNSQLASAVSSPFGVVMEDHLLRFFSGLLGFCSPTSGGIFTSGGTEANYTAVLCALTERFPQFENKGLVGLATQPRLYVSTETHHSFLKAAKMVGLGLEAVVEIPVTNQLTLNTELLKCQIAQDRKAGHAPFMIVGTLGSTSAGINDPLGEMAAISKTNSCWFHVDAAWGGAACLLPEFSPLFAPCGEADSLTLDAHKWLNVPMTAGMYFSRRAECLDRAFRVTPSAYMPKDSSDVTPPYHRSLGWSRRFNGLKLFLSLASAGVEGYRQTLRHQIAMGNELRKLLTDANWALENETPFPVVCFSDQNCDSQKIADLVGQSGKAWVTTTQLTSTGKTVLRAGISNAATQKEHLKNLVKYLDLARRESSKT